MRGVSRSRCDLECCYLVLKLDDNQWGVLVVKTFVLLCTA